MFPVTHVEDLESLDVLHRADGARDDGAVALDDVELDAAAEVGGAVCVRGSWEGVRGGGVVTVPGSGAAPHGGERREDVAEHDDAVGLEGPPRLPRGGTRAAR